MKKVIGIYGLSGAGKTTFCEYLKKLGCRIINADDEGRKILEKGSEGLKKVTELFGREYLLPDGSLNRKNLGRLVFSDPKELERLNSVTKPALEKALLKAIDGAEGITVIDGALVNSIPSVREACDEIILLKADISLLAKRLEKRDNITEEEAKQRLERQLEAFSENCTGVITNNSDINDLKTKAERMIEYVSQGRTINL